MNDFSISTNIPTLILITITLLSLGACLFFIGYLLGKNRDEGVLNNMNKTIKTHKTSKINNITIDDNKFVTDIKTDNLEKKYQSLGDIKKTEENISESINKLKNLKG